MARFPGGLLMDLLRGELADDQYEPFAGMDIAHAGNPNHPELSPDGPGQGQQQCNQCALMPFPPGRVSGAARSGWPGQGVPLSRVGSGAAGTSEQWVLGGRGL